jgi:hypothetical protein
VVLQEHIARMKRRSDDLVSLTERRFKSLYKALHGQGKQFSDVYCVSYF